MAYTDEQIKELDEFARSVILVVNEKYGPQHLFAAQNREAYRQYFAEVVQNISSMTARDFFESDLAVRRGWGNIIAADLKRYETLVESEQQTEVPDNVKEMRAELASLREMVAKLAPVAEAEEEAEPEAEEPEAPAEPEAEEEEEEAEEEEAAEEA